MTELADLDEDEYRRVGEVKLRCHADPFYAECRAYGGLIDSNLNGEVAAFCHGYLTLPAEVEVLFDKDYPGLEWNRPSKEYRRPPSRRQPFRAILKDFIADQSPLSHMTVKKVLQRLRKIRENKIYPIDIAARNYRAGLLLDFSIAMTEPYFLFEIRNENEVRLYRLTDLTNFDQMVEDENVKTWIRALPKDETIEKLRARQKNIDYKITRTYRRK